MSLILEALRRAQKRGDGEKGRKSFTNVPVFSKRKYLPRSPWLIGGGILALATIGSGTYYFLAESPGPRNLPSLSSVAGLVPGKTEPPVILREIQADSLAGPSALLQNPPAAPHPQSVERGEGPAKDLPPAAAVKPAQKTEARPASPPAPAGKEKSTKTGPPRPPAPTKAAKDEVRPAVIPVKRVEIAKWETARPSESARKAEDARASFGSTIKEEPLKEARVTPPAKNFVITTESASKEQAPPKAGNDSLTPARGGDRGINIHPVPSAEATTHFNMGLMFHRENKLLEAYDEYRKAIQFDPMNLEAQNNLGIVYKELGRTDDAVRQYQKVLAVDPKNAKARHNLAVTYFLQGDLDRAADEFLQAIRNNPRNPESYNNLGLLYKRQKRYVQARETFLQGLNTAPDYAPLHYNLALTLEEEKDWKGAILHYQKFLEITPDSKGEITAKVRKHLAAIAAYVR